MSYLSIFLDLNYLTLHIYVFFLDFSCNIINIIAL